MLSSNSDTFNDWIYERIQELGYEGGYTQVKVAVRELLRVRQEVFMPLMHRVGEALVNFGYALVKASGASIELISLFSVITVTHIVTQYF